MEIKFKVGFIYSWPKPMGEVLYAVVEIHDSYFWCRVLKGNFFVGINLADARGLQRVSISSVVGKESIEISKCSGLMEALWG